MKQFPISNGAKGKGLNYIDTRVTVFVVHTQINILSTHVLSYTNKTFFGGTNISECPFFSHFRLELAENN